MNILIIKVGALGDVVRSSFIAQALKDKYRISKPEIYWITDKKAVPFFINNPYVNHVLTPERKSALLEKEFDLVVNLEEDEENCKFASKLKKRKLIGAFLDEKNKIDYTKESEEWFNMSMISRFGKKKADILKKKNRKTHRQIMAGIISVDYKKYEPYLRLTEWQRNIAQVFSRRYNISKADLVVGINTGSADRWPKSLSVEKTADLINNIYDKYKAKILLFGGKNEIERNKEIQKLTKSPVIDTGCGNDLTEFPALLSVCSLVVSSDSLGLHIALALKRKTISLIGPTSSYEIDMYGFGEKIVTKSNCVCCYKKECKSMQKINVKEIITAVDKLLRQKIALLITAFKEPNIARAIDSALNQSIKDYELIVAAPDKETLEIAEKYAKKHRNIRVIKDPGKGKSFALNMLFEKIDSDILVMTDGDVYLNSKALESISNLFLDPSIGCATGRPVPVESREDKYGYWAHFLFESAHKLRKKAFENNKFLECSGYLFAFRKKKIDKIPLDVAEDTVIPYYFWERGYRIGYAESAEVYVKNVDNWNDWIKQKTRTSKAHETLHKYADVETTPRVKNFGTEASGISWALRHPENIKEFFWIMELIFARLYMWSKVHLETKMQNKGYGDAWERVESTK